MRAPRARPVSSRWTPTATPSSPIITSELVVPALGFVGEGGELKPRIRRRQPRHQASAFGLDQRREVTGEDLTMPPDAERVKLLFVPYTAPPFQCGDKAVCL